MATQWRSLGLEHLKLSHYVEVSVDTGDYAQVITMETQWRSLGLEHLKLSHYMEVSVKSGVLRVSILIFLHR